MLKSNKPLWLGLGVLLMTLFVLLMLTPESQVPKEKPQPRLPVSTVWLKPVLRTPSVSLPGVTQARWTTALTTAVEGRVKALTESLEPGQLVKKGQRLVSLREEAYRMEVDNAASQLAQATLSLARIQHEQTVMQKSGGTLATPFARLEPQVEAARRAVAAATSALNYAQQRLIDTRVTAPFDAIVLAQSITPGQWVQPGQNLLTLGASDSIDIKVEIPESAWEKLGHLGKGAKANVSAPSRSWDAKVRYIYPMREAGTRQRSLILMVQHPYIGEEALLPDQQVIVTFDGLGESFVFDAPASTLTEDGYIWSVDDSDRLRKEAVSLVHQDASRVWFRFMHEPKKARQIALYPLSSMIQGQAIAPVLVNMDGGPDE